MKKVSKVSLPPLLKHNTTMCSEMFFRYQKKKVVRAQSYYPLSKRDEPKARFAVQFYSFFFSAVKLQLDFFVLSSPFGVYYRSCVTNPPWEFFSNTRPTKLKKIPRG